MATQTEAQVLAHHGITVEVGGTRELRDAARAEGLIYACLECGSVGGIDPADGEAARLRTADFLLDCGPLCCGEENVVVF